MPMMRKMTWREYLGYFMCLHAAYTRWHVVTRVLESAMWGTTHDEVQQRECIACGHVQRREIEKL